jgi:hypothetical protein
MGPGGSAEPHSLTITVKQPPKSAELKLDEEGIRQARDRWKKRYEATYHATFSNEQCQPLPSIPSDSAHWTCREKITGTLNGNPVSSNYDITFSLTRKGENWEVIGSPDFKKAK